MSAHELNPATLERLKAPEVISAFEFHSQRLAALFAGERLEHIFALAGVNAYSYDVITPWQQWLPSALDWLATHAALAEDCITFRPLIVNWDPRGVHFIDHLFGADVFQLEDTTWQAYYLEQPIGQLEPPDLEINETWRQCREFALTFTELDLPAVTFALPTLSSALNIGVNLYGQRLLETLLMEPEAAHHDLQVINATIRKLHAWYRANLPAERMQCIVPCGRFQPPGYGQLCGCTCQLVSAGQYAEFLAPLDGALLGDYPGGGMIHLCGAHFQHIPLWREMTSLRAVQTNDRASEDLEAYHQGLREDQIIYPHPCEEMPVERILELTGGRRIVLCAHLTELMPVRY